MGKLIQFIKKIRQSDVRTRQRWLFVFTVPTMIVVLMLWAGYMRGIVHAGEDEVAVESPGVSVIFMAGAKVAWERVARGTEKVKDFFTGTVGKPKTIEINNIDSK